MQIQLIEWPKDVARLQRLVCSEDIKPYIMQSTCDVRLNMYALDIYIVVDNNGLDVGYFIIQPLTEISCEIHTGFLKEARKTVSMEAGAEILQILSKKYKVVVGMIPSKNIAAIRYATLHKFKFCGIINNAVELVSGKDDLVILQRELRE